MCTKNSSTSWAIFWTVLLVVSFSVEISAKRGCQAYGHVCYGGHGKRSSYPDGNPEHLELEKSKDEPVSLDYDLSRPSVENIGLVLPQAYNQQEIPRSNSILPHDQLNWSILRKLLIPARRPYMAYPEVQK